VRELDLQSIASFPNVRWKIEYKGMIFEETLRLDVLVKECLLLELKSVEQILAIHKAQLLSYMKLLDLPLGLLTNFHEVKLTDGIHRMILPGANC
jgi:GxxExxY protein